MKENRAAEDEGFQRIKEVIGASQLARAIP
jgi:hypothetical protein